MISGQNEIISKEIFRAYDIRGIVDETLTAEVVYQIGLALGSEARSRGIETMIAARDGRLSSPILSMALQQGLLATGCNVIDIGEVPTPVLYFATQTLAATSGVMITGSHNPGNYNGLKIVLDKHTLTENEIQDLYRRLIQEDFIYGYGDISECDVLPAYIERITSDIKLKKSLKIVVDAGNGIAGKIAPNLLRKLGCEVHELFCDVDGAFPNHEPDPSQPKNLIALISAVRKLKADVGIAFDGDADRLGVVTDTGEIIWPDRQMMLFADSILKDQPHSKIIFDIKCSRNLPKVIENANGIPIMWKTGHSLIKAKMLEENAAFAGEMSGHFFFKHRWYGFDDGMYSAARLLEIVSADHESVSKIFARFPNSVNTPEIKLPIAEAEKFIFMEKFVAQAIFNDAIISTIDGIRVDFPEGWGLLRPSNTTPCLILRFEAKDERWLESIKAMFRRQLLSMNAGIVISF